MNKTTTLKPSEMALGNPEMATKTTPQALLPIYAALAKEMDVAIPFPVDERSEMPTPEHAEQAQAWFDSMDQQTPIHKLRRVLQMTVLGSDEEGLRALIQRYLRKRAKNATDRDKIDFLLVQYLALCAPPSIYHKQVELQDVAQVMEPVLGKTEATPLAWCQPLEKMIVDMREFRSLREILKTDFIEQGRRVKESAGEMFYEPASLLAFVQFSFLMRRTLIELMHADLGTIRAGLAKIEDAGMATIDCSKIGLSAEEPVGKIRELADEWKQPFQKEYTERTVNEVFGRLLHLRAEVENALQRIANERVAQSSVLFANEIAHSEKQHPEESGTEAELSGASAAANFLDFDTCLEQIWEQLIATPPMRGRSMTTVKIRDAKVLMSSWEMTAFVSENSPAAEDLRRAVVARALVNAAVAEAKKVGRGAYLDHAVSVARIEVSRLQERVDVAKQAKDTEAAVNLGISTKRLLSALDEVEKV